MPSSRHTRQLVAALAVLASPVLSFAQGEGADATPWGLGIGVAAFQRPYTGVDAKAIPFPLITYENEWIRLAGVGADLKLFNAGGLDLGFRARFALADGYKSGDAPILDGMATRKGSVWIGPEATWNSAYGKVSVELLSDAMRKSKGLQARLGVDRNFRLGAFVLTPHAAAAFVDSKYVDYYYGVSAAEATAGRPAYEGKSTVNLEGGLRTAFMFNPSNSVFVDLNATLLGKGITDSPLVDHKVMPSAALGYLYRF